MATIDDAIASLDETANRIADERNDFKRRAADLEEALFAAAGYLTNAAIDLETGAPKATALRTINGGLKLVREALAKAGAA